ncbi:MAG TPA: pyridoxal phosphate-dependent aminotransferase [Terriglobia bacterium]|nr:pyridoxal phosphate-dependent aminotransferase [Terriglobia bacterium]
MQFSERISRISVSATAAVFAKADQLKASGVRLVDFGAGEPDFPTPQNIKQAAVNALNQNFTKYTPTGGIRELRQAIVDRHARDFGSGYTPEECLVTVGGKQAVFEAVLATVNHGDEVILPVPYWVSFLDMIRYAGGTPVLLETREQENFQLSADDVARLITPKTKLIIVNSPNNPTGAVVCPAEWAKLLALAVRHKVLILADECYCYLAYEPHTPFSVGSSRNLENLLVVGSFSKTYAMTGWRLGFALGPAGLIANMLKLQSHSTSNATSFVQMAAIEALTGPQDCIQVMRAEFQRRRDRMIAGLQAIPGIQCTVPEGAFYAYPNVSACLGRHGLKDTATLAERLLEEARVVVMPGEGFGTRKHLRLSFTTSLDQIDEGMERLRRFFAQL